MQQQIEVRLGYGVACNCSHPHHSFVRNILWFVQ